jgi:ubiquitin-activating enzyme E1 C
VPGNSACVDCTLDLYPPQVTYPLCTIANTPRLPEHCIEYVKVVLWPKENPFNSTLDGDDSQHIGWVYEKSVERALQFNITGVTYRLVQGVVKNIIPAVASTNAVIAGICATEVSLTYTKLILNALFFYFKVFKIATSCCLPLNNYMVFNDVDGIYTYTYTAERKDNCVVCSQVPQTLNVTDPNKMKLKDLINLLCEEETYQMKNPGLTTVIDGKNKTLYISTIKSIEERTRDNLNKTLVELGLKDGTDIMVADTTSPMTLVFTLKFLVSDVEMN